MYVMAYISKLLACPPRTIPTITTDDVYTVDMPGLAGATEEYTRVVCNCVPC